MDTPPYQPQSIVHHIIRIPKAAKKQMKKCGYSTISRKSSGSSLSSLLSDTSWMTASRISEKPSFHNLPLKVEMYQKCLDEALKISSCCNYYTGCDKTPQNPVDLPPDTTEDLNREEATASLRSRCSESTKASLEEEEPVIDVRRLNEETSAPQDFAPKNPRQACPLNNKDLDFTKAARYPTINQNDFMMQCMIDTSSPCFVHFFVSDSAASQIIDQELGELYCQKERSGLSTCRFMRHAANAAPFITTKLQIRTQSPTVICLHNGQIFDRFVDVEGVVQCPGILRQWALGTGLLDL
jgi:hypothetical protein